MIFQNDYYISLTLVSRETGTVSLINLKEGKYFVSKYIRKILFYS